MSYMNKAKVLGEEITELKYKKIILQKEINRDEEKLEFVRENPSKVFMIENIRKFERLLQEKERELVRIGHELREKMDKYNIYISKIKSEG